jgi:hypothetical protein
MRKASNVMRDAGTMVMLAGTLSAHLHIRGSSWGETTITVAIAAYGR